MLKNNKSMQSKLKQAEITNQKVDVVVNAANP